MPEASPATGASESAEVTQTTTESEARSVSQDVTSESSPGTKSDAKPESSPGQAEKPGSLLDAVKAAVEKSAAASPAAEGGQSPDDAKGAEGKDQPKDQESEEELPEELTEEELARYHSKTRRRILQLKTRADEATARLKEAEPAIQGWNHVVSFMSENGLTGDEANAGFSIMAAMKGDPFRAKEMLTPYWNALCQITGDGALPTDLQKAVDEGRIDEPYAREVAANRARAASADDRAKRVEHRSVEVANHQAQQVRTQQIQQAVNSWESNWQKSDPDFSVKQQRTLEKIRLGLLSRSVQIDTPEQAVAFAEKCRQEVENELRQFVPKKTAVSPVNGVAAMTGSRPKPTSLLEAMKQAVS